MAFPFNTIQIALGIITLLLFLYKLVQMHQKKTKLKYSFTLYLFFFLMLETIVEVLEHLSEGFHELLEPIVPWIYLFTAIFILVVMFWKAKEADLL